MVVQLRRFLFRLRYPAVKWTVFRTMAGKSKSESKEIFLFLKDHLLQEKYVYRHNWSKYDICLSDQVHSLHKRDAFIGSRELWRSGIWI